MVLLEVVQFISGRDDGILEVPNNTATTLLSRYIPAAVMLPVAIMYSTFGYSVTPFLLWYYGYYT